MTDIQTIDESKVSQWKRTPIRDFFHFCLFRPVKYFYQRRTRGWDDSATWSLDDHLAQLILPRLKRFREVHHGFPGGEDMTEQKWAETLDKMIFAFEWDCDEDRKYAGFDDEEYKRVQEGHELFGKWFNALWD